MKYAAVDGKNGGSFVLRWNKLIEQIIQTCELSEKVVEECFGKDISIHTENHTELIDQLRKLTDIYSQKGKVTF